MSIESTLNIQANFQFQSTLKRIALQDATDYTGTGATSSAGLFKLTGPDGSVFYKNSGWDSDSFASPDVDEADDSASIFYQSLPVDSSGNILLGNYTIEFKTFITGGAEDGETYTLTKTHDLCYTRPTVNITKEIDCFASYLKAQDSTDYAVDGYTREEFERLFKLAYPAGVFTDPLTTGGSIIQVTGIYSKTWAATLDVTTITYYSDDDELIIIEDTFKDSLEIPVSCDSNLCDIYCGIANLNTRYLAAAGKNILEKNDLFWRLTRVLQLMQLFYQAQKCSRNSDADAYLAEMYTVGQITPGCGCEGDEPVLIIPVVGAAGGSGSVVVSGTNGITVIPIDQGDGVTEYQVNMNSSLKNKLENIYNSVPVTGSSLLTISAPVTSGNNRTYTYTVAIPAGHITATMLASDSVTTAKILDANVTADKLAANAVTTAKIADANVTADKLAANAVTTAKILDANVTADKLASDSVTTAKILDANVTADKLAANAVTTAKIADSNVTADKLANDSVTTAKIAALQVTAAKLAAAAVETAKINDGAVTADKLASDSVVTGKILNANVTAAKLANDSVTTDKILDANVTEAKLVNGAVTTSKLGANAVTVAKLDTSLTKEVIMIPINFAAAGQGAAIYNMYYGLEIMQIEFLVEEAIAATDNATIALLCDGVPVVAPLDITAASARGARFSVTPIAPKTLNAAGELSVNPSKATAGGKGTLILHVVRT